MQTKQNVIGRSLIIRTGLTATLSLCLVAFAIGEIQSMDPDLIARAIGEFSGASWTLAAFFTIVSFAAISGYDPLAAKLMGLSKTSPKRLARVGWQATAIAQCVGFGPITATFARWYGWRNAPEPIPLTTCFRVTCWMTGMFFVGWLVVTNSALLLQELSDSGPHWAVHSGALALFAAATLFICRPGRQNRAVPSLGILAQICLRAALDTLGAAAVIFVFLPTGFIDFSTLYTAFLIAYVGGMVSGLPGGVGAFEVIMLMLIPQVAPEPLLAALVAFRLVYFIVPACVAAILLHLGAQRKNSTRSLPVAVQHVPMEVQPLQTADTGLLAMRELSLQPNSDSTAAVLMRETRHTQVIFGSGMGSQSATVALIDELRMHARHAHRAQVIYKCHEALKRALDTRGYVTAQVACDATIDLQEYDLATPARRTLRRKLKKASKAGLEIRPGPAPMLEMEEVDAQWRARNGPPKGFSMGRFSRALIAQQRVYCAFMGDILVAYVTFLEANGAWCLDLMRSGSDCPDGTMHALVVRAIEDAQAEAADSFSLASIPFHGIAAPQNKLERVFKWFARRSTHTRGLAQFKQNFAPTYRPVYLAVSNKRAVPIALWTLFWLVHRPRELSAPHDMTKAHHDYDNYEIASTNSP